MISATSALRITLPYTIKSRCFSSPKDKTPCVFTLFFRNRSGNLEIHHKEILRPDQLNEETAHRIRTKVQTYMGGDQKWDKQLIETLFSKGTLYNGFELKLPHAITSLGCKVEGQIDSIFNLEINKNHLKPVNTKAVLSEDITIISGTFNRRHHYHQIQRSSDRVLVAFFNSHFDSIKLYSSVFYLKRIVRKIFHSF